MKMLHRPPGRPAKAARAGRVLAVVLFVLGVVIGWVGHILFVSGGLLEGRDVPSVAVPAEFDEAAPAERIAQDHSRSSVSPSAGGRTTEVPARVGDELVPAKPTEAERMLENEERVRRLRLLTSGADPSERLALAREILEEPGIGPLTMRALSVLVELEPVSAAQELRQRIRDSGGETSGLGMAASLISRLGSAGDALTPEDLAVFFDSGTADVQVAAAKVLAERGDDALVQRFLKDCSTAFEDEDPALRLEAVRKLAMFRSPESTELLTQCLEDGAEEVRLQAVLSIGFGTRDPAAIDGLRALENDPSERVRTAVSRQLEMLERLPAVRGR